MLIFTVILTVVIVNKLPLRLGQMPIAVDFQEQRKERSLLSYLHVA